MTLKELKSALKELNIPVAYSHFKQKTNPPYITFLNVGTNNFFADNRVYEKNENIEIELYTSKKDTSIEEELEKILNKNEIAYEIISDSFIQSESLFQTVFSISI